MDNRSVKVTAVLAAVVAVLAVAALVVTTYLNASSLPSASSSEETAAPVEGTPEPAGPVDPTGPSAGPTEPDAGDEDTYVPDARTRAAINDVTVRFLQAWATQGEPAKRMRLIGPYATEYLTKQLARVDPAELPTTPLTGTPELVGATPYAAATETAFNPDLRIRCNLLLDTSGWRVSEVLPADETDPSPSPPSDEPSSPPAKPGKTQSPDTAGRGEPNAAGVP